MELIIILWTIATEQKVRTANDKIPPPQKKNCLPWHSALMNTYGKACQGAGGGLTPAH